MRNWAITDVRIYPVKNKKEGASLLANVSVTIDDCFVIHEVKIVDGKKGAFVSMPQSKNNRTGEYQDICHPLDTDTRNYISQAIMSLWETMQKGGNNNGIKAEA